MDKKNIHAHLCNASEMHKHWFRSMLENEIEEMRGTMSNEKLAMLGAPDEESERMHIQNIFEMSSYIDMLKDMAKAMPAAEHNIRSDSFIPTEWQDYADEHIIEIRALDSGCPSVFEVVAAKRMPEQTRAGMHFCCRVFHRVIFIDDYLESITEGSRKKYAGYSSLNYILDATGYKDIDDFVKQNATSDEWVNNTDGTLDRENSPSYVIDLFLLASIIAEFNLNDDNCFVMTEEAALDFVRRKTGKDYKTVGV